MATQIFFIFTPKIGEDSHFDLRIFFRWVAKNHQPVNHFDLPLALYNHKTLLWNAWADPPHLVIITTPGDLWRFGHFSPQRTRAGWVPLSTTFFQGTAHWPPRIGNPKAWGGGWSFYVFPIFLEGEGFLIFWDPLIVYACLCILCSIGQFSTKHRSNEEKVQHHHNTWLSNFKSYSADFGLRFGYCSPISWVVPLPSNSGKCRVFFGVKILLVTYCWEGGQPIPKFLFFNWFFT